MGNPKQKWTSEEEEALRAGIAKHGPGKWKLIQKDPEFNPYLHSRSNIDLKDKWRNMSAAVQGSRDKSRPLKLKSPGQDVHPATPLVTSQPLAMLPAPVAQHETADHVKDDSAKDLPDAKNGPRYNDMIFEALTAVKEQNGLDISAFVAYIEKKMEVPHNFRKQLGARLRRLVQQDKLEKVDGLYRLKSKNSTETNASNRKDIWARQQLASVYSKVGQSLEEAAKTAAYKVVEAEEKANSAAEAVIEAEKLSKLAEETDSILQFAEEILGRCTRGDVIYVA
ncbi:unnamed protein product [Amaranthus hypochondriacus]